MGQIILLIAYVFISIAGVTDSLKDKNPKVIIVIDIVTSILASIGMIVSLLDIKNQSIKSVWLFVVPFLVIGSFFSVVYDLRGGLKKYRDSELSEKGNYWGNMMGVTFTIIIVLLTLWINFTVGYGN